MLKSTPGPWEVGDGFEVYAVQAYRSVAMVLGDEHANANSRLIAAAPDLVEACQRTLAMLESAEGKALVGDEGCLWGVELLRAALSKAGV